MKKIGPIVIYGLLILGFFFLVLKGGYFNSKGTKPEYPSKPPQVSPYVPEGPEPSKFPASPEELEFPQSFDPGSEFPPQPIAPTPDGNSFSRLENGVVYSGALTSGSGDSYCAQHGLVCTNLVSCQLEMGGCKSSEYCGDPRTPQCPCTARCAPSKEVKDDQGQCGSCRWVDIDCSHYGGVWTGTQVSCDPQHAGVIVMKKNQNDCGPQHLEWYTQEKWVDCFTPRAQCVCN